SVDARRAEAQIVAEDAPASVREIAVEPHLHQCPARDRIEPAYPRGAALDGNYDLVGIDARLAREAQPLDDDVVDREAVRVRLIIDRRQREFAIERCRRAQTAGAHGGGDRAWLQDIGRELQPLEAVRAEIEPAADPEMRRIRRKPSVDRGLALLQPGGEVDRGFGTQ